MSWARLTRDLNLGAVPGDRPVPRNRIRRSLLVPLYQSLSSSVPVGRRRTLQGDAPAGVAAPEPGTGG
ncbi:hypothetical protein GCM10023084_37300 [Streptomyces lacrimifluminis]|uniref:Uncharacterized protein n=1 Tax=Streptomyces lacrimifluminis TaxID=1500077 RepID=A0A917NWX8_9ACTN|nr:hypothetical protein GCM10012282_36650 [Streptomyces lacrimifluminis]